jgi:hypothetical protein
MGRIPCKTRMHIREHHQKNPVTKQNGQCNIKKKCIYRVSQEECAILREGVPYFKIYRYNPKHLCPKFQRLRRYTVGRTLWRGISSPQCRYLHTDEHTHRRNAHRHPCLEWNSNPQSQCSNGRRRFMP